MFLFRLFCAFAVLTVAVCAYMPWLRYEEIDSKVIEERKETFFSEIRRSLTATRNFFARIEVKISATAAGRILAFGPYVGQAAATLPAIQDTLAVESDFKDALMRSIPDWNERVVVANDIRNMEYSMKNISRSVRLLREENRFTSQKKTTMVQTIHNSLETVISRFAHQQSIFRKYPLISIPPIFALASFLAIFDPIANALVPSFSRRTVTSCQYVETLKQYRALAVHDRLNRTEIVWIRGDNLIEKSSMMANVERRPYNQYGYNQTNSGTIQCTRGCRGKRDDLDICLEDLLDQKEFYAGIRPQMHSCIFGYMELLRHRVERVFEDPINLVNKTCTDLMRNRPKIPTGNGWWTITIDRVNVRRNIDGSNCDDVMWIIGFGNSCDPYVKIFIDDEEVFKTTTKIDINNPNIHETYRSHIMRKAARIRIEIWDEDDQSTDDLMLSSVTSIESLLKDGRIRTQDNDVYTTSIWKDQLSDDEFGIYLWN